MPVLLNVDCAPPKSLLIWVLKIWVSVKVPALLIDAPLPVRMRPPPPKVFPLQVVVCPLIRLSVRPPSRSLMLLPVSVSPPFRLVTPVPVIVPLDQVMGLVAVIVPVPPSVPPPRIRFCTKPGLVMLRFAVPPLSTRLAPKLGVLPVKFTVPPLTVVEPAE